MPYTCRRCHLEVPQGLDVCPNCGAAAQRPDAVIRCRHCHRRVRSNLAVCPHCGRSVQAWRPDLPFAAVGVLILVVLWLGFGNGSSLLDRARTSLVALLPPAVTPAPLVVLLDTPTPEDIGDIPIAGLIEEPDVVEIAPLEAITDVATLATTEPLTITETLSETEPISVTEPAATTVLTPTLAATETPTSIPTATATTIPASPTPSPTAPPSRTPTATPSATVRATPTGSARTTASPTSRPTATPSATLRASPRPTQTPTNTPPPPATPTTAAAPDTYIVRAGDTLLTIAQSVGRTVAALAAYNNIADPRALRVGQVLQIPPVGYVPPTAAPPTPAPTRTRTPTPAPAATPTPAIALGAPTLIEPGDNASFKGADGIIYLRWQNVGGLPEGVANMLHIGVLVGPDTIEWRYIEPQGQATDFKVPAWLFGQAPQEFGRTYVWYVQAVSGTTPVSPPSAQRRFLWD